MADELAGRIMLLTGATDGIGLAAARDLASRGASLVVVGRNPEKAERVTRELRALPGSGSVEALLGDLSSLADVRRIAAEFRARHDRLHVLANNAGAVFLTPQLSADGFEMTFALNHLSYFALTRELLDVLRSTPAARVINTSSGAHRSGRIDFDDIVRRPSGRVGYGAYGDSKLANILFTRELARRLAGSGVTANCFHPGFVRTAFGQNNVGIAPRLITFAASFLARTPEKGAETLVWLATSDAAAGHNGEYFIDCRVARTKPLGRDDALAARLWSFSEELCA